MPTVETSTWIAAPLDTVLAIAKDNRSFPEFMEDLESLTVVEEDGSRVVSDYVGVVNAFKLKVRWRQQDEWDDAGHCCYFKQLEGDYDTMDGTWKFSEENGGTRFDSVMNYEYRVPGLGPLVGKVIFGLVRQNLEAILDAIKRRAESVTRTASQ
ncbi:MAG: SRPBCC family protein [Fimbriimonadaceae bacterium]|nr:SRPBCC family protein [Fimbriimonadaceae bacterium]